MHSSDLFEVDSLRTALADVQERLCIAEEKVERLTENKIVLDARLCEAEGTSAKLERLFHELETDVSALPFAQMFLGGTFATLICRTLGRSLWNFGS